MWRIQPHANQRDGESEAGRRTSPARADPNRPYGIIILPRCRDWACFPSSIPITTLPPCAFVSICCEVRWGRGPERESYLRDMQNLFHALQVDGLHMD